MSDVSISSVALRNTIPGAIPTAITPPPDISAAQLAANRANAQFSTGPKTADGKANSSHNALKTGLTGHTVLLPSDDEAAYQSHIQAYIAEWNPIGIQEADLVQSIADIVWRLKRIPFLEKMIYLKGRKEFAELFADADPAHRAGLLDLHIYEVNEKKLRNLHLQESRLSRRREKEISELKALQEARAQKESEASEIGSEFSTSLAKENEPTSTTQTACPKGDPSAPEPCLDPIERRQL
jgi:hypothetical protein